MLFSVDHFLRHTAFARELLLLQRSHVSWKTWKIIDSFSSYWKCPGILENQEMSWKCPGKILPVKINQLRPQKAGE